MQEFIQEMEDTTLDEQAKIISEHANKIIN